MKVFLSHPMHGLSEKEVLKLRNEMINFANAICGEGTVIIDNYSYADAPENTGRLWYLGRSIQMMSDAELVIFHPDYRKANGCRIEEAVCSAYRKWHIIMGRH